MIYILGILLTTHKAWQLDIGQPTWHSRTDDKKVRLDRYSFPDRSVSCQSAIHSFSAIHKIHAVVQLFALTCLNTKGRPLIRNTEWQYFPATWIQIQS